MRRIEPATTRRILIISITAFFLLVAMAATLRSANSFLARARPATFSGPKRFAMVPHATGKDAVNKAVTSNKVVVYSKTYCPYCSNVKSLMKDLKVEHIVFELDTMGKDGDRLKATLQSMTGRGTVPQVFVGGKFIGGCDDTVAALKSGKLKTIFKDAGVSASF